ncbi:DNA mismatch repair protein MutS [Ferruginibacter lapsinanis]|uniref:DNA mismatch repair protein MutS n=1 Tax=Ferruginibacter lapsinanis TaxID=563172 RepID=UPI001E4D4991|nr:DNA mismatch repair protein MutS [Ferruginibacter lapsinanis]UEG48740.1 DNA mismatch repair protein MutS [Ferruginibacter lapsinanis]
MAKATAETPLMQQHNAIKARYPDAILLFRVGDFYETFGQDAVNASTVLGITLTKRNNGNADSSQLAGFPHHALDTYLHKLVKAGYRVAICDQLEDPKQAKGIVKRGVTELVTPGVATNDKLLEHNSNNFLASIHFDDAKMGIAFLDISTGEFFIAEGDKEYADKLLQSLKPAEVIFQRNKQKIFKEYFGLKFFTYGLDEWIFADAYAQESLLKHFGTHSLKGFGIEGLSAGIIAAGAILHYLKDTEHPNLGHITSIQRIDRDEHLWMDRFTIRNLELFGGADGSNTLLKVLDNTVSPMGARLLKRWMVLPLNDITKINERLATVEFLIKEVDLRNKITLHIKQAGDVERLASKVPLKKVNPREVLQIAKGLQQTEAIKLFCENSSNDYLKRLGDSLNPCKYILDKILKEINENPPALASKGGMIASGINEELDGLRKIASGGKDYLIELQQKEAAATGISSLKISFNNVFGYYLEVTNIHKSKVPDTWIRKQTLANAERYITPELKEYEEKIVGAEDKIFQIELQIFEKLLNELQDYISPMQVNGHVMAIIDCLSCFANNALQFNYKKPALNDGFILDIKDSRHPVIERNLPIGESYIANDILLDPATQQIIILTGPNMSGKSAILRQTALITLMAHMGSFVPASDAKIPLTDKIFTRVGASDNLSGGESTFMVEMNETASIINNITSRSLILLDEIGRGTSTYDGISIAWSIVEYLHNSKAQPKTLFATHYHELNELENKLSTVKNYHVTNKEVGNKIIFLRKLAPGGSVHSFGIHVARMAGMPPSLIDRSNEILKQLEDSRESKDINESVKQLSTPKVQLSIFDAHSATFDEIRTLLNAVDINRLTPVEALLKLQEIKEKVK